MHSQKSHLIFVAIAGLIIELFLLIFISYNGTKGNIPLYMFVYSESFLVMLTAYYFIRKPARKIEPRPGETASNNEIRESAVLKFAARTLKIREDDPEKLRIPLLVILFGILFRLTLFPAMNTTSPDVSRYIWEGKVLYNGYNPYILPPADIQLEKYRDDLYEKVTYKNMSAIYPPFSEGIFVLAYLISGEHLYGLKLIYLAFDIFIMLLLLKLLNRKRYHLNNIILYAWMPLVLLEYYVNTHLDLTGIFFMVLFIYFTENGKLYPAAITFSLSVISKIYPVILFPLIIKKFGPKRSLKFLALFLIISVLSYGPFIYKNIYVFSSLFTYLRQWQFNASVYYVLLNYLHNPETARLICAGAFVLSVGIISYFYKDFTKACYTVFISLIIFSTTLFPWYLGWIAALNPFYNFYSVTSLLFTVNFTNFTTVGDVWREYIFVIYTEYILFFGLLVYDLWRMHKKKKSEKKILIN